MDEFTGSGQKLKISEVMEFADKFDLDPAVVMAVCEVESSGGGFLRDKHPKILFESHVFFRETKGLYGNLNISSPKWDKSLYGRSGAHQYERLRTAMHLDRKAALKSASWGMFQILGANHKLVGFDDVEDFVKYNCQDEIQQLELFGRFCEKNNLLESLRNLDWEYFTSRYNGPGQVENYKGKLIQAYGKWKAEIGTKEKNEIEKNEIETKEIETPVAEENSPAPDLNINNREVIQFESNGEDVKYLQLKLDLFVDGIFGPVTDEKVRVFQMENDLVPDGVVGPLTWAKIEGKVDDNQ